ncbi:class I adenylate-forming enzyme family protein [Pseudonocardia sp. NPDC046786]|uniref:class I adenylate-forming enzyme family protein n=1 Tax=Pseudonocardia sp. NPDC046786 TaxID=3155471 RepID=UPI0033F04BF2
MHLITANRPEFLDVWFGCARLGAVVVPVNPLSTTAEVAHQLTDSHATLSVADPQLRATVVAAAGDLPVLDADELPARRADAPPPPPHRPAATAAIMFTSGTTSAPKGVQVTPANYLRAGRPSPRTWASPPRTGGWSRCRCSTATPSTTA